MSGMPSWSRAGRSRKSDFDISLARARADRRRGQEGEGGPQYRLKGARPEDLEAKRAEIKALEAAVANAKNQLDYAVLKAPFDGKVAARYVDNFQTVQAKQPIVRLLDVSKIEVTIQVPESLISLVPRVKKARCRFDALPGKEFVGQVTKIGSEASQTTRTYPVTVAVDQPEDAQILPGMAATVRRHARRQGASAAAPGPGRAAQRRLHRRRPASRAYVWVVEKAARRSRGRR